MMIAKNPDSLVSSVKSQDSSGMVWTEGLVVGDSWLAERCLEFVLYILTAERH